MLLAFLGVVLTVVTVVHLYLWLRLVRDTTARGTRARRLGGVAIVLVALAVPATMAVTRSGHAWAAWGFLWLPLMFYLILTLAALEVPMLAARLWLRRSARRSATRAATRAASAPVDEPALVAAGPPAGGDGPATDPPAPHEPPHEPPREAPREAPRPDRRLLLARGAAIFAGLTATGITGYGMSVARSTPRLDRVQVPLDKLPRSMDGFRIAVVSDIHLGPLAGRAHAERVVAAVNRLDADLIAVVGDLVDGSVEELSPATGVLRGFRARRGTYFVTGNHEYYSGVEQWLAEVPRLGMRVLRNERVAVDGLDLAGVNDLAGEDLGDGLGPDFDAALGGRDRSRPVVLLAHQPIQAHEAARHGVDLQLSGHTHGGQMVPFNLLVRLQQPMVSGLGEVDGTKVYVTDGAGFWGPPVRVGVPPQVSLVQLRTS